MQDIISRANSDVRPTSAEFDEIPNLVVDEIGPISDDETSNLVCESTSITCRGKFRGRGLAKGNRGEQTTASGGTIVVNMSEVLENNSGSTKSRKRKVYTHADDITERRVSTSERTLKRTYLNSNCVIKSE